MLFYRLTGCCMLFFAILEPTTSPRGSKGQHPGCALPRNGLLRRRHRGAARQGQAVPGDTHLRGAGQLVVQAGDGERVRGRVIARRAKGDLRAGAPRCRAVQRAAAHSRKGLQLLRGCVRSTRLVSYTACSSVGVARAALAGTGSLTRCEAHHIESTFYMG